nr:hypothetical protein [Tanacetum cinerariifolium]
KMAKENIPAPTRSDEQLVLVKARLPYRKSNLLLELQKLQKNPIFRISVDILHNTNFFRAFTASGIQTFFSHRAILSIPSKKSTPHDIPYCQFIKIIIYYLGSRHNIHRTSESLVHVTGDDFLLVNLKFIPKGKKDKVFGMHIPKELITEAIQQSPYYQQYQEMVARKPTAKEGGKKKTVFKAEQPKKPTPVKKPAPGRSSLHLVDGEEQVHPEPEPQVEDEEYDLQRETTPQLLVVEGKVKCIATNEQAALSLLDLNKPKEKIYDTPSPINAETCVDTDKTNSEGDTEIVNVGEEQGEDVSSKVDLEEKTDELDEGQARSNPVYLKVHESLKHTTEEHVHLESPLSSSGTLSSMKNLEDNSTFGDQFINDKPIEEDLGKTNMETEVKSMVTVSIHQTSSSVPPLSTHVIDLTPPRPISSAVQEPVFTATPATTTIILPPPPPLQQQSSTDPKLANHVSSLEKVCANFEKKHKLPDQTIQAILSRVFTLENHDLYFKIDKQVREMFKSGSYKSHMEHEALYEALEASMDHDNIEEFLDTTAKQIGKSKLSKVDLEDQVYLVKPEGNQVLPDISKPLPLGGPPDFKLEELVLSMWIESEPEYDISAAYGISHLWFKRKEFHITSHSSLYDRRAVRSHMQILSVISLKTYSRYGYTFLQQIVLRRADYKEYNISEADFKNLHPNDFEDLYLLYLQGYLNHLSGAEKTKHKLSQPRWDASNFLFKEDYTIVHKPRAVIYKDRNNQKKTMRESEVHKFSDGTLTRIMEKLDHMVKDFVLFKFNPGMENRIWSKEDKRMSKEFIEVIERRLKIRRIFKSLESFMSGRLRDVDYRLIQRAE